MQRVAEAQALIEIDHQLDVVADGRAHGVDRREIVGQPVAAEPQLQPVEAALGDELQRFVAERRDVGQPEPVAVVGRHRRRASRRERPRAACRPPWPAHPMPPCRGPTTAIIDDAFVADEIAATFAPLLKVLERPDRPARCARRARSWMRRHDVAHGLLQIGLEIAAADDAFLGLEIDQDQRPSIEQADLGHDRAAQRHEHRAARSRDRSVSRSNIMHLFLRQSLLRLHFRPSGADVNSLCGIHSRRRRCRGHPNRRGSASSTRAYGLFRRKGYTPRQHGRDRRRDRRHQAHAVLSLREQGALLAAVLEAQHHLALAAFRTFGDSLSGVAEAIIERCSGTLRCGRTSRAGPAPVSRGSSSSSPISRDIRRA